MRVLVLDDLELYRRQLVVALEADPALEVVDEVTSLDEALAQLGPGGPEVAVVALGIDPARPLASIEALVAAQPGLQVVALLSPEDEPIELLAVHTGAAVAVARDRAVADLPELVRGLD